MRLGLWLVIVAWSVATATAVAQDPAPPTVEQSWTEAATLMAEGEYHQALAHYTAALIADPEHVAARHGRALAFERLQDYEAALRDLNFLVQRDSEDIDAIYARGRVFCELGETGRALVDLRRASAGLPESGELLGWLGRALAEAEDYDASVAVLERAVATSNETSWILGWYGYALYSVDDYGKAERALQRAVAADPTSAWALGWLAATQFETFKLIAAQKNIERAIAIDPEVGWYHWIHGNVLDSLGYESQARDAYQRAGQLDSDYAAWGGELTDEELDAATALQALLGLLILAVLGLAFASLIGLALTRNTREQLDMVYEDTTPASFDGRTDDLFKIYVQNVALTVATLGIYKFWAAVRWRRYRYQHTSFAGGRLDYHATGKEKFMGFLKGLLILVPFAIGLYLLYQSISSQQGESAGFDAVFFTFIGFMFLLRPLLLVGKNRFNLARTSWSNLRFRFTGSVQDAYKIYLRDLPLILITFGIYLPWHRCNVRRFRMQHTRMGEEGFDFRGDGGELLGIHLGGTFLSYFTLGMYLPWMIARLHRFHVENTTFRGRPFYSTLTGGMVLSVAAPSLLAIVLTLGLAIPWAARRWYWLTTDSTLYNGVIDTDELRSIHDARASSLVEGVGEAGDALAELGEMFGG